MRSEGDAGGWDVGKKDRKEVWGVLKKQEYQAEDLGFYPEQRGDAVRSVFWRNEGREQFGRRPGRWADRSQVVSVGSGGFRSCFRA